MGRNRTLRINPRVCGPEERSYRMAAPSGSPGWRCTTHVTARVVTSSSGSATPVGRRLLLLRVAVAWSGNPLHDVSARYFRALFNVVNLPVLASLPSSEVFDCRAIDLLGDELNQLNTGTQCERTPFASAVPLASVFAIEVAHEHDDVVLLRHRIFRIIGLSSKGNTPSPLSDALRVLLPQVSHPNRKMVELARRTNRIVRDTIQLARRMSKFDSRLSKAASDSIHSACRTIQSSRRCVQSSRDAIRSARHLFTTARPMSTSVRNLIQPARHLIQVDRHPIQSAVVAADLSATCATPPGT